MALQDAVIGAIADGAAVVINCIARRIGRSEIEAKRIEKYITWTVIGTLLVLVTVIYR